MNTVSIDLPGDLVLSVSPNTIEQALHAELFPDEYNSPSVKRRRLSDGAVETALNDKRPKAASIYRGIAAYQDQVLLFRNKVYVPIDFTDRNGLLASSLEHIFESVSGASACNLLSISCKFQLDVPRHRVNVQSLVPKFKTLLTITLHDAQLREDIDLFTQVVANKKLIYAGSPLVAPPPVLCFERHDGKYDAYLDFGIALPDSSYPTLGAAEITVFPLYGKLMKRAFPSLSKKQVETLLAPQESQKQYDDGNTLSKVGPKVTSVEFYMSLCSNKLPKAEDIIQPNDLMTPLLDFQRQTVQWCLLQEGKVMTENGTLRDIDEKSMSSSIWGWTTTADTHGNQIWIAPKLGLMCKSTAKFQSEQLQIARSGAKGLLAEEMGLGKSLETIALMLLNRRPEADCGVRTIDLYSGESVIKAKTNVIVAPTSIHKQWLEELQRHAPSLSVKVYLGSTQLDERVSAKELEDYDVILTTYKVMARELHFTQQIPARSMRNTKKYEVFRSPLVQLEFWRVILDEVQLVESGAGHAAMVARAIPRCHAWGVSGTPFKNNLSDLAGILQFLRYPFVNGQRSKVFDRLCHDSTEFCNFFSRISVRHTKDMVKDSIALPPQRRIVLTIPFTTVEENNYRHLFQEFLDDCGFNADGSPARDDWNPTVELSKMSHWLSRLRQTCCHAQIGVNNRRALGGGPLRTVSDVLEAMYDGAQTSAILDERMYWESMIHRAQLLEQGKQTDKALELFTQALEGVRAIIEARKKQLAEELQKQASIQQKVKRNSENNVQDTDDELTEEQREEKAIAELLEKEEESVNKSKIVHDRARVRLFLDLEHRCLFFIASIYFQKENKELEDKYYDLAQTAREELLSETQSKAQKLMDTLASMAAQQKFVEIPSIDAVDEFKGGLEIRKLVERAHDIYGHLNEQANCLDEWREKVISLLSQTLVDRDSEADGEEYGNSLDAQEEGFSYQEAIRQTIADRNEAVTGIRNNLVEFDIDRENQLDERTDLAKKLQEERKNVKPPPYLGSLKLIHDELRRTRTQLSYDAEDAIGERRQRRLEMENILGGDELTYLRNVISSQKKAIDQLDKESLFFRSIYNARIEYYKQLQQISDDVAEFKPKEPEKFVKTATEQEKKLRSRIDKGYARLRYLEHLRNSVLENTGSVPESERICVICQSAFEIGSLTVCGHQYCRDCMLEWWKFHRTCPICKKPLKDRDIYNISYKPTNIHFKEERLQSTTVASAIYAHVSERSLNKIKSIDLLGSYGSKIDMILRHMIWLRENESNAQVIIFSQWGDFLSLVSMALLRHNIKYASVEKNMDQFKSNPEVMCFLLNARSQSSGLTLINATHVILCEPLFNTALELQAISRIHRIGQSRPTTVWMYAIGGTVEESVLSLSTKHRLMLMNPQSADNSEKPAEQQSSAITDANLDISNSMELQRVSGRMLGKPSEGEIVPQDELWDLFFGESAVVDAHKKIQYLEAASQGDNTQPFGKGNNIDGASVAIGLEYRRFTAAEAAEERARDTSSAVEGGTLEL
ncbi:SNF2 family N-terminal domain-containing protein [Limtongia smithiae]|uniref:SNF2 family N-terminal domain-containing protein n=1 Tax=Limtongia smithiae TaxID=1125753 RepID=UPI0034CF6346